MKQSCNGCPYNGNARVCAACKSQPAGLMVRVIPGPFPVAEGVTRGKTPFPALNKAKGKHKPGVMNKIEAAYDAHLASLEAAGEIAWRKFEGITLKLAPDTRYTPDFFVMMPDGFLECHEVKGFWQEDAKIKIKVAAAMFPFRFKSIMAKPKKDGGGWKVEEI